MINILKFSLSIALLFATSVSSASGVEETIEATVSAVYCGEINAGFGDACIVLAEKNNKQLLGLVFDFDNFTASYGDGNDLKDKKVLARGCQLIQDAMIIRILKSYDAKPFYLNCTNNDVRFINN